MNIVDVYKEKWGELEAVRADSCNLNKLLEINNFREDHLLEQMDDLWWDMSPKETEKAVKWVKDNRQPKATSNNV